MKFGFKNKTLQTLLIDLLNTISIKYQIVDNQIVTADSYDEVFDSLIDAVKHKRFKWHHSFRPLDPDNYSKYVEYMRKRNIDFEEELVNDVGWFSTEYDNNHYDWGIEDFKQQ